MLETWNLVCTPTHVVSENIPFSTKVLILLMSAFFCKKNQHFLVKIVPLLKARVWELCWRFFSFFFSVFVRQKITIIENVGFIDCIRNLASSCSKLAINWQNNKGVTICWHDVVTTIVWQFFVSLVKFSCMSKIHVNIITGSGVMPIFFSIAQYLESGGEFEIANLVQMFLLKCYWMLQNTRD